MPAGLQNATLFLQSAKWPHRP